MKKLLLSMMLLLVTSWYCAAQICNGPLTVVIQGAETSKPLAALETHTDPDCKAGEEVPNGTIDVAATGGKAPYSFDWADIVGKNNKEDRTQLRNGSYHVTITDANGCTLALGPIMLSKHSDGCNGIHN